MSTLQKDSGLQIRQRESRPAVFRQVVIYVLDKVAELPNIGETTLHKLLYFIDFDYYEKFEENLMGETYIKNHFGPTSKNLIMVLGQMEDNGVIRRYLGNYHGRAQNRVEVLQKSAPTDLIEPFIEHIDHVLAKHSGKTAKDLTEFSHGDTPWICAVESEYISYESVFYRDEEHSVKEYDDDL